MQILGEVEATVETLNLDYAYDSSHVFVSTQLGPMSVNAELFRAVLRDSV